LANHELTCERKTCSAVGAAQIYRVLFSVVRQVIRNGNQWDMFLRYLNTVHHYTC